MKSKTEEKWEHPILQDEEHARSVKARDFVFKIN
jgi:hypothetical protein